MKVKEILMVIIALVIALVIAFGLDRVLRSNNIIKRLKISQGKHNQAPPPPPGEVVYWCNPDTDPIQVCDDGTECPNDRVCRAGKEGRDCNPNGQGGPGTGCMDSLVCDHWGKETYMKASSHHTCNKTCENDSDCTGHRQCKDIGNNKKYCLWCDEEKEKCGNGQS